MTGLSAKNDKIIEIGAARVRGGEIVDTISTLVNQSSIFHSVCRN